MRILLIGKQVEEFYKISQNKLTFTLPSFVSQTTINSGWGAIFASKNLLELKPPTNG
jgi:hypothetical protein